MQFKNLSGLFIISLCGIMLSINITQASSPPPPCKTQLTPELCAKIGQMLIVGFGGLKQDEQGQILWQDPNGTKFKPDSDIVKAIANSHIGGVILFVKPYRNAKTGEFIRDRNVQSPRQLARLNKQLQQYSNQIRQQQQLPALPLFVTVDQEGGLIDRLPAELGFPQRTLVPQALGANEERVFDQPKLKQRALRQTYRYAKKISGVLADNHFNVDFVPSLDVNVNPLNPVIGGRGRAFSANPQIVADQAEEFIRAFHDRGIIASLKHFPGHGSSTADSHEGLVDVTKTYHKEQELLPYRILIKNGYEDMIMTTHVINGQIDKTQCKSGAKDDSKTWCPGTLSYATLTKLLRQELGFKGVIVSDDMNMGAMELEYPLKISLTKAINAGVDMFIVANNEANETELIIDIIAQQVKAGKISKARIEDAYQRIVKLKQRFKT